MKDWRLHPQGPPTTPTVGLGGWGPGGQVPRQRRLPLQQAFPPLRPLVRFFLDSPPGAGSADGAISGWYELAIWGQASCLFPAVSVESSRCGAHKGATGSRSTLVSGCPAHLEVRRKLSLLLCRPSLCYSLTIIPGI